MSKNKNIGDLFSRIEKDLCDYVVEQLKGIPDYENLYFFLNYKGVGAFLKGNDFVLSGVSDWYKYSICKETTNRIIVKRSAPAIRVEYKTTIYKNIKSLAKKLVDQSFYGKPSLSELKNFKENFKIVEKDDIIYHLWQ